MVTLQWRDDQDDTLQWWEELLLCAHVILYICVSIPALQVCSSVPFF